MRQPRARGTLRLSARPGARIRDLHQSGSLKALFPASRHGALNAVFLNTSGGVTGGDQYQISAEALPDAALVLTSQAAERLYRAQPTETGRLDIHLKVGQGARLDWLPQETILFDAARVVRRFDVDLAPGARFLAVEPLISGRLAMGEYVHSGTLTDHWRLRRDGQLIFADTFRLSGDIDAKLARPAVAGGNRAVAALIFAAPEAEALLPAIRDLLGPLGGASLILPDLLFARIAAPDGFELRKRLIPAITRLSGQDIPRTWTL
ncbi:urease accessory protein UreD [Pseudooceanicola spongiae]|uniref:Urease accessory protein UreD n=1 Tax=Pseudooceanicola spongiae TaxID=2613965 RepID=A0A7L9WMJ6_9RHOB|nr:urease accessory protein UreD [Pseudooceanicola spongiae]QOL81054.1 urease accessory protein UreD [Pseudooceanicola spongiae]